MAKQSDYKAREKKLLSVTCLDGRINNFDVNRRYIIKRAKITPNYTYKELEEFIFILNKAISDASDIKRLNDIGKTFKKNFILWAQALIESMVPLQNYCITGDKKWIKEHKKIFSYKVKLLRNDYIDSLTELRLYVVLV